MQSSLLPSGERMRLSACRQLLALVVCVNACLLLEVLTFCHLWASLTASQAPSYRAAHVLGTSSSSETTPS
jgi:hypothetical protein